MMKFLHVLTHRTCFLHATFILEINQWIFLSILYVRIQSYGIEPETATERNLDFSGKVSLEAISLINETNFFFYNLFRTYNQTKNFYSISNTLFSKRSGSIFNS